MIYLTFRLPLKNNIIKYFVAISENSEQIKAIDCFQQQKNLVLFE